jgi:hypothetical protein
MAHTVEDWTLCGSYFISPQIFNWSLYHAEIYSHLTVSIILEKQLKDPPVKLTEAIQANLICCITYKKIFDLLNNNNNKLIVFSKK